MNLNWTRIVAVLAVVAQVITLGLHFGTGIIPTDVQIILSAVLAAISAVTERVQGGASKV